MSDFFQASYFISEVIALSGIALNMSQIIVTCQRKCKKAPFDLSVISLSIADLFSSCFTLFFMIYWHLIHNSFIKHIPVIASINVVGLQFSVLSSMFHLGFIAIQRVFAVISPLMFRLRFTSTFCSRSVAVIWVLSLTASVLNIFVTSSDIIGYIVLSSELLLIVTYSIICFQVKKQDGTSQALQSVERHRKSAFRRIFLYSVCMSFAFVLCTLPSALYATHIVKRSDPSYVYEWVRWMFYLNPTVDSILYFYFKKGKRDSSRQHSGSTRHADFPRRTASSATLLRMSRLRNSHCNEEQRVATTAC